MTNDRPNPAEPGEISKFKCDFCGAVFEAEEELRKHEDTCKGDKIQPGV